jgi:hypothetical protein
MDSDRRGTAGRPTIPEQAKAALHFRARRDQERDAERDYGRRVHIVEDEAEAALFGVGFGSNALTGLSLIVSHGSFME